MALDHRHSGCYSLKILIETIICVYVHTQTHTLFELFWAEIYFG